MNSYWLKNMINKLEIMIITYNRSKDLDKTLNELLKSPFSNCKITILDNCSTDRTLTVCKNYKKLFKRLQTIRHPLNIGGSANFLRAIENSTAKYTWILCDDDHYDFSECHDIIDVIEAERIDLISVGHPNYSNWERGIETNCKKLIEDGFTYFITQSFLPSSIFKRELYDSICVQQSYVNIHNLFPHFVFINKSVVENFSIYVSKNPIVIRGEHNNPGFSRLEWLTGWINSCSLIKNKKIRKKAIYEICLGSSFIKMLLYFIVSEKIIDKTSSNKDFITFISGYIKAFELSKEIFLVPIIIFLAIVPSFIYRITRREYLIMRYGKEEYHKRNIKMQINSDPLRKI